VKKIVFLTLAALVAASLDAFMEKKRPKRRPLITPPHFTIVSR
jgi:hypothetical protein